MLNGSVKFLYYTVFMLTEVSFFCYRGVKTTFFLFDRTRQIFILFFPEQSISISRARPSIYLSSARGKTRVGGRVNDTAVQTVPALS